MRKFGLAAILTFVDKGATAGMGRVGAAAKRLQGRFRTIGAGVRQIGRGLGSMATAALPLVGAFGLMIKKGAEFEQSIANLRSKMLDKFDPALKGLAKTLGATTVFSATQAANAMTELAKAGFDVQKIVGAIPSVLAAAAAENIPLAQTASIVADTLNQFKLPAKQASAAANTLALASVSANTSMVGLAEGLKLAAPLTKTVNATFADTTAILAALADVGLKGTTAGTALRAGIGNLVDPGKKAKGALRALGLSTAFVAKKLKTGKIAELMKVLSLRLTAVTSGGKRGRLALRLFGKRAIPLAGAMAKAADGTDKFGKTLAKLRAEFKSGGSAAEKMAKIQLGTLIGQGKLAASAIEGISIELFKMISPVTRSLAEGVVKTLSDLALAMRVVGGEEIVDPKAQKQLKGIGNTIFEVARGIKLGIGEVKVALKGIVSTFGTVGKFFGLTFGPGGAKDIARIITKFAALTAILAPVAGGFLLVTKFAGGMKDVVVGTLKATVGAGRVAAGVLTGVLGKIPVLGRIFGGIGGLIGKAARISEKLTARPVRVVNFDEAPGGIGAAAAGALLPSGARELDLATTGATSAITRMRLAVNGFAGRIPGIGGLLTRNLSNVAGAATSLGGKLGAAGLAGAALGVGVAFGTLIDRTFGLSQKIGIFLGKREAGLRKNVTQPLLKFRDLTLATTNSQRALNQLLEARRRGITTVGVGGGRREAITREFAQRRIVASLERGKLTQRQIAGTLASLAPLLAKLPTKAATGAGVKKVRPAKDALVSASGLLPVSPGDVLLDRASLAGAVVSQLRGGLLGAAGGGALGGGSPGATSPAPAPAGGTLRVEVPLTIDGRQIALAIASVQLDDLERSGAGLAAGQRSSLLQRGFREET